MYLVRLTYLSHPTVAFAARSEVGDPAFIHNSKKLAEIPTKAYAASIRANVTDVSSSARPTLL